MKKLLLIGLLTLSVQNSFGAIFTVSTNANAGAGSLRAAITAVNASGDATNSIVFTISNSTITLTSADLPTIVKQVTMDGTGKNITIDGSNSFSIFSLAAGSDGSIIKGLTITKGNYDIGIQLESSNNNTITGNTLTKNLIGILLESASNNNTITGNTIAGNCVGIQLESSNNNTITGNNITGSSEDSGIVVISASNNNTITGNNITGGLVSGIRFSSDSMGNKVLNTTSFNNTLNGIVNTAGNGAPTPPMLTLSRTSGQTVFIQGTFTGTANNLYLVQFFKNEINRNPITEGAQFLGQQLITTDNAGNGTIYTTLPISVTGSYVSATVTDQVGTEGTSEYSLSVLLGTESPLAGKIREKYCTPTMNSIAIQ